LKTKKKSFSSKMWKNSVKIVKEKDKTRNFMNFLKNMLKEV